MNFAWSSFLNWLAIGFVLAGAVSAFLVDDQAKWRLPVVLVLIGVTGLIGVGAAKTAPGSAPPAP